MSRNSNAIMICSCDPSRIHETIGTPKNKHIAVQPYTKSATNWSFPTYRKYNFAGGQFGPNVTAGNGGKKLVIEIAAVQSKHDRYTNKAYEKYKH